MKLSLFIARRLAGNQSKGFSRFIIRLATVATALSVAVMIISVAVVFGFKDTIKDKMFVFWGNLEITPFNPNPASIITPAPFRKNQALIDSIKAMPEVSSIYPYALKPAIVRAKSGLMEGIKLKGIENTYPIESNGAIRFEGNKISFPDSTYSNDIILSQTTVNRLDIANGDTVMAFFIDPESGLPRIRKLKVAGNYHTGMSEIDQSFGLCDIRLLRRVSNWGDTAINGYQVVVKTYQNADSVGEKIYRSYLQPPLYTSSMEEVYPNIYNWLDLINRNVYIILTIMAIVAVVNLSTALLIFILERTNMTGILKSLGMANRKIQRIFLYHASMVALKGILYGTIGGVIFCLLQEYLHLIPLPEATYYMRYVPIELIGWHVLLIDLGTLLFCMLLMTLPALFVRRINLIKALRFQ